MLTQKVTGEFGVIGWKEGKNSNRGRVKSTDVEKIDKKIDFSRV